jgi:hypothetical protein
MSDTPALRPRARSRSDEFVLFIAGTTQQWVKYYYAILSTVTFVACALTSLVSVLIRCNTNHFMVSY